jgi:hypothetical protein
MAEGYRADQINDFVAYANAGFATTASIHFNQTNDFYDRYYNDLNIVRYDTISPESGVDTVEGKDNVKSILNYNNGNDITGTADMNRIKAVIDKSDTGGKCGLKLKHVDAVIVLVNANLPSPAHSWTFDWQSMGNRNGEPVHYVIIRAPVGGIAETDAIAHELGHAMASLSDEYMTSSYGTCSILMDPQARNITNDFFGSPITLEARWDGIMADYAGAVNYPVGYNQGGNYCGEPNYFYRPTEEGTMRYPDYTQGKIYPAIGPQFGPVNTYYMYGTWLNRINPDNVSRHQWPYYYTAFKLEWPVSDF